MQHFSAQDQRLSVEIQNSTLMGVAYYPLYWGKSNYRGVLIPRSIEDETNYNAAKSFQDLGLSAGVVFGNDLYLAMEVDAGVSHRSWGASYELGYCQNIVESPLIKTSILGFYYSNEDRSGSEPGWRYNQRFRGWSANLQFELEI